MNESNNKSFLSLRKRAEALLNKPEERVADMSIDDIEKLVQELHTHQIELELQNEDLKKAQLELSDVLKKYKDFYNLPPIGYLSLDEKGVIQEANLPVCEMLGKERSLLLNKKFNSFLPRDSQDSFYFYWRDCVDKKTVEKLDIKLRSEDKGVVYARMECIPFKNDEGTNSFKVILFDITDRKTLEQKLRDVTEKLQSILSNIPEVIYSAKPDSSGAILYISDRWEEWTGYSPEESYEDSQIWPKSIHPDDRESVIAHYLDVISSGKENTSEYRLVNYKTGKTRWVYDHGKSIKNEKGTIIRYDGIVYDITKRKETEEALKTTQEQLKSALKEQQDVNEELKAANEEITKTYNELNESEERFEKIFNNAPDGIHLVDPETRKFIIGNTKFCEMIGYKPEEIDTIRVDDIHPKEDLPYVLEQFEKVFNREIEVAMDIPVKRRNGTVFYVDVSTFLMNYMNRKCLVGIFRDITERKEIETALKNEIAYSENLISSLPGGFWMFDMKGITSGVNPAMARMLGYSQDELIKMSPVQITPDEYAEETKRIIKEPYKGNIASGEQEIIRKDKKRIFVSIVAAPIKNYKNEITGAFAVIHDITEMKKNQQLVLNTQKMQAVGTLAGGMAHEFNNILGVMMGYVQLLKEEENLTEDQYAYLNLIYNYGEKSAEIIKNVLNFSRKEDVEMELIDLGNLLKDVVNIIKMIKTPNIKVSCDIEKDLPLIRGNPTQIQQALINISNNSIQAMREKEGTLKFSLELEKRNPYQNSQNSSFSSMFIKLCIEDEGCGISDEVINRVFDPFFTTKDTGEGTGLGLSVVHGIMKAHNGEISLESKQNVGTVLCMFFPAADKEPDVINHESVSKLYGFESILIVEDEVELSKVLAKSLSKLNYRVSVSSDSKEAFEKIRKSPEKFDIVISDYAMPGMNGFELYEKISGIRKDLPFIIVTGHMDIDLEKLIADKRNIKYLIKPAGIPDLTNLIRSYFDK